MKVTSDESDRKGEQGGGSSIKMFTQKLSEQQETRGKMCQKNVRKQGKKTKIVSIHLFIPLR